MGNTGSKGGGNSGQSNSNNGNSGNNTGSKGGSNNGNSGNNQSKCEPSLCITGGKLTFCKKDGQTSVISNSSNSINSSYPSNSNQNSSNSVSLSNFSGGNVSSGKSPYYLDLDSHFLSLKSKFSTFDVGYGKIHTDSVIGGNPNYKGTYIDEIINTVQTEVSKSTLHHKLAINLYNRGVVDTDLYTLGSKLSGVTLNLCLFDLQKNNITTLGANNFIHFF